MLLRSLSISAIALSSLFASNAGAATSTVAHQRAPVAVSSHSKLMRHRPARLVSPANWARVLKDHMCEQQNWHADGPTYFGGLGWLWSTWQAYRLPSDPVNMAFATPMEQGRAMVRFVNETLHYWPHQGYPAYCGPGY